MSAENAHAIWIIGELLFALVAVLAAIAIISDVRSHWRQILDALFAERVEDTDPTVTPAATEAAERIGVRHG